jgi:hypothetical protein
LPFVPVTETVSKTELCGFWVLLDERVTTDAGASTRTVSELLPAWLDTIVPSVAFSRLSAKL